MSLMQPSWLGSGLPSTSRWQSTKFSGAGPLLKLHTRYPGFEDSVLEAGCPLVLLLSGKVSIAKPGLPEGEKLHKGGVVSAKNPDILGIVVEQETSRSAPCCMLTCHGWSRTWPIPEQHASRWSVSCAGPAADRDLSWRIFRASRVRLKSLAQSPPIIGAMSQPVALSAVLGAAAMGDCAFLAPGTSPEARAPRTLRGASQAPQGAAFGSAAPSALMGAGVAAAAVTACRAAAVKKKGVKVIHGKEIPWNLFTPKAPYQAKVVPNQKHPQTLTEDSQDPGHRRCQLGDDTCHLRPRWQGPDKKGETPARIRLYSIASSAVGDDETSKTVSLCVKRVVEVDGKFANREVGEESGCFELLKDKPDKAGTAFPDNKVYRGVCSNHICDLSVGDDVMITGPTGAEMLLPEDPEANIVMLATGTGIAPMRAYCRYLFNDKVAAEGDGRKFKGLAWLFMGVPYSKSLLYDDEHQEMAFG
eukprot:s4015_g5.t1